MIKDITEILQNKLIEADLKFVDNIAGLVQRVEKKEASGKVNYIPVAWSAKTSNGENIPCKGPGIEILPDQNIKGFIFFEESAPTINTGSDSRGNIIFENQFNLICWLNRDKITGESYKSINSKAQMLIINALKTDNFINVDPFMNLKIELLRIAPTDSNIFRNYTFDEQRTQYLTPPFEYFSLNFRARFSVSNCIDELILNPKECL